MTTDPAPVVLTPCPDGPILVRGDVEIRDAAGRVVPRRRATVALCRCGASGIKPFCDGSHKAIGFRTDDEVPRPPEPVPAPGADATPARGAS
ncbi:MULTISPECIES: CDGSH iron-sulfur domain-containing protein [unclassified Cellulomonas]|jgi:CDGSH-type Zn-finger protein|uniref:CDGSH iron-sulfur domain-containing protein n=1 Tax=unclassified Cellulomonas TaxID=2620175 RepID=UPI001C303C38|nr:MULTISPECIES: CDGSH iron-sulfur domain-containing protein [unclassified Cellulomonas]MBW0254710.1 CDGSH iron-sulfur domain-containing protein [Cellulomonas sp. PS-H5]